MRSQEERGKIRSQKGEPKSFSHARLPPTTTTATFLAVVVVVRMYTTIIVYAISKKHNYPPIITGHSFYQSFEVATTTW